MLFSGDGEREFIDDIGVALHVRTAFCLGLR
jgi:hypothetical protein